MFSRSALVAAATAAALSSVEGFLTAPLPAGSAARLSPVSRLRSSRPSTGALASRATASAISTSNDAYGDLSNIVISGLNGIALKDKEFPNKKQVFDAMPADSWKRDDKASQEEEWGEGKERRGVVQELRETEV
eukprot:749634-Hanusia_phi.AAC.1